MTNRLQQLTMYQELHFINVLASSNFNKSAFSVNDLMTTFKSYFDEHMQSLNPNENKLEKIISLIAPGGLFLIFRALGLGKLGFVVGLAMEVFHIDVGSIINSVWSSLKPHLENNQPVSTDQVTNAVNSAVNQETPTEPIQAHFHNIKLFSLALDLQEKEMLKLSNHIIKNAANLSQGATTSILKVIIKYLFLAGLASAGFMVAGDVINKVTGRGNAIDHTLPQSGSETTSTPITTKQTKFTVKNDEPLPSSLSASNNQASIQNVLINFAKETYNGLDDKDSIIASSPAFKNVLRDIVWYNSSFQGSPTIYFPSNYTSKKKLVDFFIDDVANKSA